MKIEKSNLLLQFCILIVLMQLFTTTVFAQSEVKVYKEAWTIQGYKSPDADPNPIFFKNESYQGASKFVYPYKLMDNIISEKESKTLNTVILENEYIKLCVTPEIGGKLYYATDKTNGYNFIYKNNTFKPANIGMHGAWVSGGIEWCLIHHHRPSTFLPIDYEIVENKDGSKTIWVGEIEQRHRMRWTVGITVFPGKSYFQTEVRILNRSAITQSFLYWANVATHVNKNYQVIFPESTDFGVFHAKNQFLHWPIAKELYNNVDYSGNVDVSRWINHPKPTSIFAYDLKDDFSGGYDFGSQTGTVHIADHNIVKGAKVWEWGPGKEGQIWDNALSDTDGPYAELMVGAFSDNQPDYSWIKPYEVKSFKQYWYPVKNTGGFKNANINGAVNLELKDNKAHVSYYSTSKHEKTKVVLLNKGQIVFQKEIQISPEQTFSQDVKVAPNSMNFDLKTFLIDLENGDTLLSYQPQKKTYKEKLPPVVETPKRPEQIETTEELFLTGNRILQFHNATLRAEDYFNEALKRDSNSIQANIAFGKIYFKKANYDLAIKHLRTAIKRQTANYTRPESCEALYMLGLALKETNQLKSAVDTLYRATWDYTFTASAYCELAKISLLSGNYLKAMEQINNSLKSNPVNNTAICLKAITAIKLNKNEQAKEILDDLTEKDPLDYFALYLRYLAYNSDSNQLNSMKTKMRGFDQNYLELATDFMNVGQWKHVIDILNVYISETNTTVNPIAYYYIGYCYDMQNNNLQAKSYYKKASELPVDYCFPFRFETLKVLKRTLNYIPNDAKAYYYLGNILFDHQPELAISYWEKAVQINPEFAIALRNLGWGYYQTEKNIFKAISSYEKAITAKNDDPLFYAELDQLYELNNSDLNKRIQLFKDNHKVVIKRGDSFCRECMVLNLTGDYQRVIDYLKNTKFQIYEGRNILRETKVDANLLLGKQFLMEKKYNKALELFLNAHYLPGKDDEKKEYDDDRMPQIDYYIGLAYKFLGDKAKSNYYFKRSATYSLQLKDGNFVKYYQALSMLNLGQTENANAIFNDLIQYGEGVINKGAKIDFFAKWGAQENNNVLISNAYLLKGLGLKGLNKTNEAQENLKNSTKYFSFNIWAGAEL